MKRPLVVALNPSMDAEWRVDEVRWEEKNSVQSERRWAGGKGVNVARWLKHLGARPQLLLPLGGASGRELAALLRAEEIPAIILPLARFPSSEGLGVGSAESATRVNVIITTRAQGQMRFNPLGPVLSRAQWRATLARISRALPRASCLVLSGSLPRGVPASGYAQLIRLARACQIPVFLDCDGPALAAAAGAKPSLVKPNEHELLAWFQSARRSIVGQASRLSGVPSQVHAAARQLSSLTHGWVCVSRGAQPALLVNSRANLAFTAPPPRVKPRNTVGAGDAMLAAIAREVLRGSSPAQWLKAGLKAGSTATRLAAGELPR